MENTQQNPLACSMQKQQIIITIPLARKPLECFAVAILNAEPFSSPSPMSTSALSEVDALFRTGWFNFTAEFARVLPALNRVPAFSRCRHWNWFSFPTRSVLSLTVGRILLLYLVISCPWVWVTQSKQPWCLVHLVHFLIPWFWRLLQLNG